jgi:hypothetical protein
VVRGMVHNIRLCLSHVCKMLLFSSNNFEKESASKDVWSSYGLVTAQRAQTLNPRKDRADNMFFRHRFSERLSSRMRT